MTDPSVDPNEPTSPEPGPSKAHGDALLDQSGSRHGRPQGERPATDDDASADEES